MIDPKDVTIIVPTLSKTIESQYALKECLKSLRETVNCRIIVVYNGVDGWDGDVDADTIILYAQGQCKAVNAAVATVNTPWIFVTNDDMVYAPGWWERLVEPFAEGSFPINFMSKDWDGEIRVMSPKLVEPRAGAPTFLTHFCGGAGGDFDKAKWLEFAKNYQGQGLATGFNLPFLIRKDLWDTVGGYDINMDPFGSNSDSDLEYKIKLAGVQPYQNTNCIVYHFSQTSGTFLPENQSYWNKNWQYFIDKWGFPRAESPMIWEANFTIPKENKFHPEWEGKYGH